MWATAIKFFAWLGGLDVGTLLGKYADIKKAQLDSGDTQAKIAADLAAREMELDVREADVNASVVKAEQGNLSTRIIRPMFAWPFILYVWKLIVWDKIIGSFIAYAYGLRTDGLDAQLYWIMGIIVVSYFGARAAKDVIRTAIKG